MTVSEALAKTNSWHWLAGALAAAAAASVFAPEIGWLAVRRELAQKHMAAYSHGPSFTPQSARNLAAAMAMRMDGRVPMKLQTTATDSGRTGSPCLVNS